MAQGIISLGSDPEDAIGSAPKGVKRLNGSATLQVIDMPNAHGGRAALVSVVGSNATEYIVDASPSASNTVCRVRALIPVATESSPQTDASPACTRFVGGARQNFIRTDFQQSKKFRTSRRSGGSFYEMDSHVYGLGLSQVWMIFETASSGLGPINVNSRVWRDSDKELLYSYEGSISTPSNTAEGVAAGFAIFARELIIDWVSWGTDGDPAPDGPVAGGRKRHPLFLTPF